MWLWVEVLRAAADGRYWGHSNCTTQAMSEEQLKAFMEAVKADSGLQEKLNAAADADAVALIAKAAGFVISAVELQRAQAGTEISEEELEGVAGGVILFGCKGCYSDNSNNHCIWGTT